MAAELTSGYAPVDGVDVYWESRGDRRGELTAC